MADQSTSGKTGPTRDKSFIKDSGHTHQIQLNIKKESGTKNIPSQKATKAARKESQLKVSVPSTSENRSKSLSTKGNDLPSKKFKNNGYEGENITSFRLTIPISNSSKMKSPIKIARAKDQMKDIKGENPVTSSSEVSKHQSKLDNQGGKSNTPDHTPPVPVFARQRSFADVVKTSPHQNTDTVLAKLTIPTGKATLSGETEENGQVNTTSLTYPEGKMKNEMEDGLAADIAVPQPSSDFLPVTRNNLDLKKEEQKTAEDILKNDQKPIFRQRSFAEVVRLPPQTEKIASILKTQNTALVSKSSQYEKPILQKVSRGNNFLKNTVFGMKNDMYQNNAYAEEEKRANSQLRTDDFINCTKEQDATLNKESYSRIPPQIQNHTKSMAKSFPVLKTGDTKIVLRSRSDIIRPQIVDSKFINKDLKRTNIVSTNDSAVSEASKKSAAELMKEVTQKRKNMLENKNRVDAKSILETTSKELVRTPERHIGEKFLQQSVKMDTKLSKQPRKERSFVGYTNGNYKQKRTNQSMANAKVSGKPSLELYKPPSMRTSDTDNMPNEADFSHNGGAQRSKSGANIDKGSILVRSNTSTHFYKNQMVPYVVPMPILTAPRVHFQPMENINYRQVPPRMMKSKTSLNLYSNQSVIDTSIPPPPLMQPVATTQPVPSLKRSKSVGCGSDLANRKDKEVEFPDLGAMSPEALACLKKVFENPSRASARTIMDGVRHLFTKLVESPKLANVAARLCIAIIEKETGETFYESLMNACQEWYRDRDRLLRSPVGPPGVSNPSPRWVAFICFLHELYLAFKRKGIPLKQDDADPASVILKLLAECCIVSLKVPAVNSLPELERVFVILTGVGRDLETSLPSKMSAVINTIRDSFLDVNVADNAGKTLLQMIELHSARWQLPATAVMYYYPSVTGIS